MLEVLRKKLTTNHKQLVLVAKKRTQRENKKVTKEVWKTRNTGRISYTEGCASVTKKGEAVAQHQLLFSCEVPAHFCRLTKRRNAFLNGRTDDVGVHLWSLPWTMGGSNQVHSSTTTWTTSAQNTHRNSSNRSGRAVEELNPILMYKIRCESWFICEKKEIFLLTQFIYK